MSSRSSADSTTISRRCVVLDVGARADPTENRVTLGRFHRAAANLAIEVAGDGRQPLVEDLGIDVGDDDVESGEGGHVGDATAHLTGPDDADGPDAPLLPPNRGLGRSADHPVPRASDGPLRPCPGGAISQRRASSFALMLFLSATLPTILSAIWPSLIRKRVGMA